MYHLKVPAGKNKGKKKKQKHVVISNMFGAVFASALYSSGALKWMVDMLELREAFGF